MYTMHSYSRALDSLSNNKFEKYFSRRFKDLYPPFKSVLEDLNSMNVKMERAAQALLANRSKGSIKKLDYFLEKIDIPLSKTIRWQQVHSLTKNATYFKESDFLKMEYERECSLKKVGKLLHDKTVQGIKRTHSRYLN